MESEVMRNEYCSIRNAVSIPDGPFIDVPMMAALLRFSEILRIQDFSDYVSAGARRNFTSSGACWNYEGIFGENVVI